MLTFIAPETFPKKPTSNELAFIDAKSADKTKNTSPAPIVSTTVSVNAGISKKLKIVF